MRRALSLLAALILSCASGTNEDTTPAGQAGSGGSGGITSQPPAQLAPATGMAIGQVSITQGVQIALYTAEGGDINELNAPLVQGRDAVVRVSFAPKADWQPHRVAVRLTLQQGSNAPQYQEIQGTPGGASIDSDLTSTANFRIPAALLDGTLSLKVEMLDVEAGQGDTSGSVWPAQGLRALGEQSANGNFRIKVFPIRYDADGSGRVPVLDDERQQQIRYAFLKQYPVTGVELEVGEEIGWKGKISANGGGWQSLLEFLVNQRAQESSPNIYYYGLFMPSDSFAKFCGAGCVAGLTLISPGSDDPALRTSIGLGYQDASTLNTILHEIGHAHRRTHAPCGPFGQLPDQIDPQFPHEKGLIGVWGYDLLDDSLKSPNKFSDFMGYCEPTWVSDYTYGALFDRIAKLNGQAAYTIGGSSKWRQVWLDVEGELRWGPVVERRLPPDGDEVDVVVGKGAQARKVHGFFYGQSHLPGGMLLVPEGVEPASTLDAGALGKFAVRR